MDEKKEHKKLAMTSTKQEMLHAYNTLLKQIDEKQAGELKPEKKIEEKKTKEAVQVAESLTTEGVAGEIGNLKVDIGKTLTRIADQMEGEVNRFVSIRNAIAAKETFSEMIVVKNGCCGDRGQTVPQSIKIRATL